MHPVKAVVVGTLRAIYNSPLFAPFRWFLAILVSIRARLFGSSSSSSHKQRVPASNGSVLAEDAILVAILERSQENNPITPEEYLMYDTLLRKCTTLNGLHSVNAHPAIARLGFSTSNTIITEDDEQGDDATEPSPSPAPVLSGRARRNRRSRSRSRERHASRASQLSHASRNSRASRVSKDLDDIDSDSEWFDVDAAGAHELHDCDSTKETTKDTKEQANRKQSAIPRQIPSKVLDEGVGERTKSTKDAVADTLAERLKEQEHKKLVSKSHELRRLKSFVSKVYLISVGVFFSIGVHLVRLISAGDRSIIVDGVTHTAATAGYVILLMASMAFRKDSPTNVLVMSIIMSFSGMCVGFLLCVTPHPAFPFTTNAASDHHHHARTEL